MYLNRRLHEVYHLSPAQDGPPGRRPKAVRLGVGRGGGIRESAPPDHPHTVHMEHSFAVRRGTTGGFPPRI